MAQKYPGSNLGYRDANSTVVEFGIALLNSLIREQTSSINF